MKTNTDIFLIISYLLVAHIVDSDTLITFLLLVVIHSAWRLYQHINGWFNYLFLTLSAICISLGIDEAELWKSFDKADDRVGNRHFKRYEQFYKDICRVLDIKFTKGEQGITAKPTVDALFQNFTGLDGSWRRETEEYNDEKEDRAIRYKA